MPTKIQQYFCKKDFLTDLNKVTDKIDAEASNKLISYCLQGTDGKQYPAVKFATMVHLINAIEGKIVIDPKKSRTYKKRQLSIAWKYQQETKEDVAPVKNVVAVKKETKTKAAKTVKKKK